VLIVPSTRLSGGLLTGLGSALAVFLAYDAVTSPSPLYWVVEAYPILLALTLSGTGVLLARGHLVADRYRGRLFAWTAGSTAVFLLLTAYLYTLLVVFAGNDLRPTPVALITIPTFGVLVGLLVGVYDARNRERGAAIERLSQANNTLRIATGEAVERPDRTALERAVCARLAESNAYDAAWVVRSDSGDARTVSASAGLDDVPGITESGDASAFDAARRTHSVQLVPDDTPADDARQNPLGTDRASMAVVPLVGADRVHGVLSVYAARQNAFSYLRDVFDELGETIGRAIDSHIARDALSRREKELERQNERLDEFASVVSHDLRNPLAVILGRAELLSDPRENEHSDAILRAGTRMETIIADLLALARARRAVEDPPSVAIAATARDAWATVDTHNCTLDVSLAENATAPANRARLRTVFENLFRNCVDHGSTTPHSHASGTPTARDAAESDAPSLTVHVGPLPDGFFVEDDGCGIPANRREDVFERGYTTNTDGTGFGLSIVAQIIDTHGWTISVTESRTGGARFEIRTNAAD